MLDFTVGHMTCLMWILFNLKLQAMARDHENYFQETATQLKSQVARLKKIPQQWVPYLKSRNLLASSPDLS